MSHALFGCLLAVSGAACGGPPIAPTLPDDTLFEQHAVEPPPGLPDDAPPPDQLQPGDVIDIEIVGEQTWRRDGLRLGQSGSLSLPLVGSVALQGLSLDEAGARMTDAVRHFDKYALVTAWLREPAGRTVTVQGAVHKPGVYPLIKNTRVSDALAMAGGAVSSLEEGELVLHGDLGAAQLVRDGQPLPVSLPEAMRGVPLHDAFLRPGDIIYVPGIEASRITVLGEVNKPRVLRYRTGIRLTEALASAGGLSKDSDDADVRIVRGDLSQPRIYRASVAAIVDGERADIVLAPGDVVFVTEHWFASATDVVRRLAPLMAGVAGAALLTR